MEIAQGKTYRSRRAWRLAQSRQFPAGRLVAAAGWATNMTGDRVRLFQDVKLGSCEWEGSELLIAPANLAGCVEEVD